MLTFKFLGGRPPATVPFRAVNLPTRQTVAGGKWLRCAAPVFHLYPPRGVCSLTSNYTPLDPLGAHNTPQMEETVTPCFPLSQVNSWIKKTL